MQRKAVGQPLLEKPKAEAKTCRTKNQKTPRKLPKQAFIYQGQRRMKTQENTIDTFDGKEIKQYRMENKNGVVVEFLNYGGILSSIQTPDKKGVSEEILLGFDDWKDYQKTPYISGIIGRCANRIEFGQFDLDGQKHQLSLNENTNDKNKKNHLHGGKSGFDQKIWEVEPLEWESKIGYRLSYMSPDGEEGYPGNLTVNATYILDKNNRLDITCKATTDQPTIVNLTNHPTFNLSGNLKRNILEHQLRIDAAAYVESWPSLIPTGALLTVQNTSYDFRQAKSIGQDRNGNFDHSFVLRDSGNKTIFEPDEDKRLRLNLAAHLSDEESGRQIRVWTNETGLHLYTGKFLEGIKGRGGKTYQAFDGLCLEAQHFPNSPNHFDFPSIVLRPGQEYISNVVYEFLR